MADTPTNLTHFISHLATSLSNHAVGIVQLLPSLYFLARLLAGRLACSIILFGYARKKKEKKTLGFPFQAKTFLPDRRGFPTMRHSNPRGMGHRRVSSPLLRLLYLLILAPQPYHTRVGIVYAAHSPRLPSRLLRNSFTAVAADHPRYFGARTTRRPKAEPIPYFSSRYRGQGNVFPPLGLQQSYQPQREKQVMARGWAGKTRG